MIENKANVGVFDRDASTRGGYVYTDQTRLSSRLANQRISEAILASTDFRGKSVVDLGCGDGAYTVDFARAGASRVLGIDPAPTAITEAQRAADAADLTACEYEIRSVYDMPRTQDERFDVAVLRGVLHHLPDPEAAVAAAFRSARTVIILEPNGLNPVLKVLERVSRYHLEHEEQSFLPSTIRTWCTRSNGRVVASHYINLVPMFCPDWMASLGRGLGPIIERIPGLRAVVCGQYLVVGTSV